MLPNVSEMLQRSIWVSLKRQSECYTTESEHQVNQFSATTPIGTQTVASNSMAFNLICQSRAQRKLDLHMCTGMQARMHLPELLFDHSTQLMIQYKSTAQQCLLKKQTCVHLCILCSATGQKFASIAHPAAIGRSHFHTPRQASVVGFAPAAARHVTCLCRAECLLEHGAKYECCLAVCWLWHLSSLSCQKMAADKL